MTNTNPKDWLSAEQAVMPDGSIKEGLTLAHPKLPPLACTHRVKTNKASELDAESEKQREIK